MKVLIVEDDPIVNRLFKTNLENYNVNVTIAKNGVEAYKTLLNIKEEFDYIVIDITLPDENGAEISKFIKSRFTSKIIIYTAHTYQDYKDMCKYDFFVEKGGVNSDGEYSLCLESVVDIIVNEF